VKQVLIQTQNPVTAAGGLTGIPGTEGFGAGGPTTVS